MPLIGAPARARVASPRCTTTGSMLPARLESIHEIFEAPDLAAAHGLYDRRQQAVPVAIRSGARHGDPGESARPDAAQAVGVRRGRCAGARILRRATARREAAE